MRKQCILRQSALNQVLIITLLTVFHTTTIPDKMNDYLQIIPITSVRADDHTIVAPKLWTFGNVGQPQRTNELNGVGVRGLFDLRTISASAAEDMLGEYGDLGLEITLTLRWKVPHKPGSRLIGAANYDVPPTPSESVRALDVLEQILTSGEAKKLAGHIYVQFYNEIAGGPGKFGILELPEMIEFATKATQLIRKTAPYVNICGPALTIGTVNPDLENDPDVSDKAEIIKQFVQWTADYADAIDIHLHGTDGTLTREALSNLHEYLKGIPSGNQLEINSWEWSPARYPNREDAEGVRNAMIGIWQAMAEGEVAHAAYGSFWTTEERIEGGANEIYLWTNVLDNNGQPHEPIYSTLLDIASGKIGIKQPDDRIQVSDDSQSQESSFGSASLLTKNSSGNKVNAGFAGQWVEGTSDDAEKIEKSGADGVHQEIDLRTASSRDMKQSVHAFAKGNLGVALTVRWSDPNSPDDFDSPPSSRDENRMINRLRAVLRSKDAKAVAENSLWVQFYDEVAGDRGRISIQDADAMFTFATKAATRIRSSSPYIKIAGPALSDLDILTKSSLNSEEQEQYDLIVRAIDWSIANADAVNVHFDDSSMGGNTFATIQTIRSFIDARPGGSGFPIVNWNAMSGKWISSDSTTVASKPAETKAQRKKRMNMFKKDYKKQLKEQYRSSGEKGWQKEWNATWKSNWESEWEKHEAQSSGN